MITSKYLQQWNSHILLLFYITHLLSEEKNMERKQKLYIT